MVSVWGWSGWTMYIISGVFSVGDFFEVDLLEDHLWDVWSVRHEEVCENEVREELEDIFALANNEFIIVFQAECLPRILRCLRPHRPLRPSEFGRGTRQLPKPATTLSGSLRECDQDTPTWSS